ncbi:MAG: hypothetical protein H0U73_09760 [Tatlockia sp.]|nr:hypothetical protein [Tatlockia sp.]
MLIFSHKTIAEELWFQPEKAILFETSIINNQRIVNRVFDLSQSANICVFDKENSLSMRHRFTVAYRIRVKGANLYYRPYSVSFPEKLTRLTELPEACLNPLNSNDPKINFDTLWHFFSEYYPAFKERLVERGLTWDEIYPLYSNQIDSNTKSTRLYQIMSEMLAILGDDHVAIYPPDADHNFDNNLTNMRDDKKKLLLAFQQSYGISIEDNVATFQQIANSLVKNFKIVDEII